MLRLGGITLPLVPPLDVGGGAELGGGVSSFATFSVVMSLLLPSAPEGTWSISSSSSLSMMRLLLDFFLNTGESAKTFSELLTSVSPFLSSGTAWVAPLRALLDPVSWGLQALEGAGDLEKKDLQQEGEGVRRMRQASSLKSLLRHGIKS